VWWGRFCRNSSRARGSRDFHPNGEFKSLALVYLLITTLLAQSLEHKQKLSVSLNCVMTSFVEFLPLGRRKSPKEWTVRWLGVPTWGQVGFHLSLKIVCVNLLGCIFCMIGINSGPSLRAVSGRGGRAAGMNKHHLFLE